MALYQAEVVEVRLEVQVPDKGYLEALDKPDVQVQLQAEEVGPFEMEE